MLATMYWWVPYCPIAACAGKTGTWQMEGGRGHVGLCTDWWGEGQNQEEPALQHGPRFGRVIYWQADTLINPMIYYVLCVPLKCQSIMLKKISCSTQESFNNRLLSLSRCMTSILMEPLEYSERKSQKYNWRKCHFLVGGFKRQIICS